MEILSHRSYNAVQEELRKAGFFVDTYDPKEFIPSGTILDGHGTENIYIFLDFLKLIVSFKSLYVSICICYYVTDQLIFTLVGSFFNFEELRIAYLKLVSQLVASRVITRH